MLLEKCGKIFYFLIHFKKFIELSDSSATIFILFYRRINQMGFGIVIFVHVVLVLQ